MRSSRTASGRGEEQATASIVVEHVEMIDDVSSSCAAFKMACFRSHTSRSLQLRGVIEGAVLLVVLPKKGTSPRWVVLVWEG